MKNQYFGDVNDYVKYGLIRSILRSGSFRPLIAWYLTPDDKGTDGRHIDYLQSPEEWAHYDSDLYHGLKRLTSDDRAVSKIETAGLLMNAEYFSLLVPDIGLDERSEWAENLMEAAKERDFVFLDPDNGIEIPTTRYGNSGSSKYAYWCEVSRLVKSRKSLLIYQHRPRMIAQAVVVSNLLKELGNRYPECEVDAFYTGNVAFFLVLRPEHSKSQARILDEVNAHWAEKITHQAGRRGSSIDDIIKEKLVRKGLESLRDRLRNGERCATVNVQVIGTE